VFEKDRRLQLRRAMPATWTWLRSIGIAAAVGVAYFLAARLSNSFLITPETVIFWPAAGISSGLLIALGSIGRWPVLAGVMIATAGVNLSRHFDIAATAAWVLGNTAEPLIIAGLRQRYFGAHFRIDRLYCVLGLFAAAVVGAAAASTWWTFAYYWLFGSLKEPTATWLHWIVSDFAGIVSVAPLVIGIATVPRRPPARREVIESLVALAVLMAMSGVIVSLPQSLWETAVPAALVFPILLWLAARWRPVFSAAGAFIVSMSVALTAIYGLGHFGDTGLSINARVLQSQAIILVVSFGTAVLAALFAERRATEARLAHSNIELERERGNRLMSIDAITAAVAHEMAQPLAAIATNGDAALEFLADAPPDVDRARAALDDMIEGSHRAGKAVDGIRALFRGADLSRQPVNVNEIALDVLQSLRGELLQHGIISCPELTAGLPLIDGNKTQLQQVVFNLVHNAIEALAGTSDRARTVRLLTKRRGHDAVVLAVQDSGAGIDPKRVTEIFDAFVTTKSDGMGLGLAICRTIVERHGGQLTASSNGKDGALFEVVLPVKSAAEPSTRAL
jgi:signal transduction histidine kinase